ncbi:hypothetical protein ACFFX1_48075 [Dactylosporangium sucinum]|uniref:Uncharacterized protein n=1 Tax=Dactylosporangium sucinum TaxID=1424081 RepID=A0A917TN01_9ACTN|nr:hypothetical protein [Dactylosporangium sucinum]GGM29674.1 hypothetical protein GCM10007977_033720 [Dactylosporangium sucinum]
MTSAERSAAVARLVAELRSARALDPARPHADRGHVLRRLAAVKQRAQDGAAGVETGDRLAEQQRQWEATALEVASEIMARARRIADLEVAAALDRARQRAEEIVQSAAGRYTPPPRSARSPAEPANPANPANPARTVRSGSAVRRVSQYNTDGYGARHHLDRTLQRAGAERARIVAEARAEARRILEESQEHARRIVDEAAREADRIIQRARLHSLNDWMSIIPRPGAETVRHGTDAPARLHSVAVSSMPLPQRLPVPPLPQRAGEGRVPLRQRLAGPGAPLPPLPQRKPAPRPRPADDPRVELHRLREQLWDEVYTWIRFDVPDEAEAGRLTGLAFDWAFAQADQFREPGENWRTCLLRATEHILDTAAGVSGR